MAWVRLDDAFFRNGKARAAGREARALYIAGLCHCAALLTDGWIRRTDLGLISVEADVSPKVANRLVSAGLWVVSGDRFHVPDYLDYNPSREQVMAAREAAKSRKRRQRHGVTDGVTHGVRPIARARTRERANSPSPIGTSSSATESRLTNPSLPLLEEAEAMLAGLRVIHGPEPVAAALARLGNAKFAWPKDLRLALERTLGPNKPPDPTESTAVAANAIYARNEARRNGQVCQRCAGDGRILPPGENVARPCPDCTTPRLRAVP